MTAASAAIVVDHEIIDMIVVNVDADRVTTWTDPRGDVVVLPDGSHAMIGWDYYDGTFYPPIQLIDKDVTVQRGTIAWVNVSIGAQFIMPANISIDSKPDGVDIDLGGVKLSIDVTPDFTDSSFALPFTVTDALNRSATASVNVTVAD